MAGLMSVRRGRPASMALDVDDGEVLGSAIAELDAAMAVADRWSGGGNAGVSINSDAIRVDLDH
jgi:hypothetical protein